MKSRVRGAAFGTAWRLRHPRKRVRTPDHVLRQLAPMATKWASHMGESWFLAMDQLQRALARPSPDVEYYPAWPEEIKAALLLDAQREGCT